MAQGMTVAVRIVPWCVKDKESLVEKRMQAAFGGATVIVGHAVVISLEERFVVMDKVNDLVTEEEMKTANEVVRNHPLCVRTPLLQRVEPMFPRHLKHELQLYLKLENMQTTGNYGKAFATYLHSKGRPGRCVLPDTAPQSRGHLIQSLGVSVEIVPNSEIQSTVDRYVNEGSHVFCHPIDDSYLIAGYASAGIEILEELPDPDVVLVCCGGGGLVSGISTAIKTLGPKSCRVYAVEPEGGKVTYRHCAEYVEEVLLVSDEEILQCVELLYRRGLVVEPSGAAAMAALLNHHVPDVEGKKVVVVITGGNTTPQEMAQYLPNFSVFNKP